MPDPGGTYFLPRLVGEARRRALALTGEAISAEQAEAWGLTGRWSMTSELQPEAQALAPSGCRPVRPGARAASSGRLNASFDNDLDRQLDLERDLQREAGHTGDYREGVAAFTQKRAPQFRGQ